MSDYELVKIMTLTRESIDTHVFVRIRMFLADWLSINMFDFTRTQVSIELMEFCDE